MLQKIYFMVFERYIPELKKYDSNSFLHQPMASGQPLKIVQRHMAHPVVLWPYLLTTKLRSVIRHNPCHSNKGHTNVVKFLMDNAADLRIDLNEQNGRTTLGRTAFYIACIYGHSDVVKIFIENAADIKIDLKLGKNVKSFFDIFIRSNSGMVQVFLENAAIFGINLNDLEDICLNLAHFKGYSSVIKIFEEYPFLEEVCKNLEREKNCENSSYNKKKHELSKNGSKISISRARKRKKENLKRVENCQDSPYKKKRYALDKNAGEKHILEDKEIKKENLKQALRETIINILKY